MKYFRLTFAFLALLVTAGLTVAGATELYDKLIALKGVISVEELDKGFFEERYVVMFDQPLDHKNPSKGHSAFRGGPCGFRPADGSGD